MSFARWKKNKQILFIVCVLALCCLVITSICGLQPTREQIREKLQTLGIEKSCKVLECDITATCDTVLDQEVNRIQTIEDDLANERCPENLNLIEEISSSEKNMPLAFSIMAHRDFPQFLKLFEAIYRPQNVYCVQIDSKSKLEFRKKVDKLLSCVRANEEERAFLSKSNISLVWQHSSLLEGDLSCLTQLLVNRLPWNYYINIVGSEFPLVSNAQLVSKLESVRNPIGFVHIKYPHKEVADRWKYSHILVEGSSPFSFSPFYKDYVVRTKIEKTLPPNGIKMMYGLKNIAISREFSEFCINSEEGQDLREWLLDVQTSIEHFYPTLALYYLTHKGIFPEKDAYELLNEWKMRQTIWFNNPNFNCYGKIKREICVLSLGDLPSILQMDGYIMNKFDSDLDFSVVHCLSEMIRQ